MTPEPLVVSAYRFIPNEDIRWVTSAERSHRSLDGLDECLRAVLPDE